MATNRYALHILHDHDTFKLSNMIPFDSLLLLDRIVQFTYPVLYALESALKEVVVVDLYFLKYFLDISRIAMAGDMDDSWTPLETLSLKPQFTHNLSFQRASPQMARLCSLPLETRQYV